MTTPWYRCDRAPGMIANYGFRPQLHLWEWLDTHMTGPFAYEGSSTAHWEEHIQVSNETDRDLLLKFIPDAKLYTEGHHGYKSEKTPERLLTVKEYMEEGHAMWNLRMYYGKHATNLGAFLQQYPVPISSASEMAFREKENLQLRRYMNGRNKLWDMMTSGYEFKVVVNEKPTDEMKDWLAQNVKLGFSFYSLPDRIGLFDVNNREAMTVVLFSDKAEAAKFKLFFG